MRANHLFKYFLLSGLILLIACAQEKSLQGGEKDITPPIATSSYPPHLSTYFNQKSITLFFDEYVQLNNINQELVVSPPFSRQPEVKVKQKSIVIKLKEDLIPNTTYLFNFGDGVTDINENNKAEDLIYVFSTGAVIDSLEISGVVLDAATDAPLKGSKVLLFESDTSIFSKKPAPSYFAKSKENGTFKLPYLREGDFFIYALDDTNSNYKWDEGEAVAIPNDTLHISLSDSAAITLLSSVPRSEKPVVNDYKTDSVGSLRLALDPYYQGVTIESLDGNTVIQCRENDTIKAWFTGIATDQKKTVRVSWNNILSDTLEIPFYKEAQNAPFKLSHNANQKIHATEELWIESKNIMFISKKEQTTLLQDSIPMQCDLEKTEFPNRYRIKADFKPGKKYQLSVLPGTFLSEANSTNDTLRVGFTTFRKEDLGNIILNLSSEKSLSNCYLQLSDKNGKVVFTRKNLDSKQYDLRDLPAGEYTAKIIEDSNQNGMFDPVNFSLNTPPEKVYVFKGKISVRANWEVKLDWKIE